jgi:tetratricopeptide (TPR) repeat protein
MSDEPLPMDPPPLARKFAWLTGVVGIALLALAPVVTNGFTDWDDPHNVWLNPDFNPPTADKVLSYWHKPLAELYIPVTYSVWGVASMLATAPHGALDPHVFHALNLLVHLGSAALVFLILELLGFSLPAAAIAAAVFAVHPVQVEAVAWVSGLKDVLCGFFSLLAIYFYLRAAIGASPKPRQALAMATAAFALALLAKPQAVVVPLIVAAIDLAFVRRPLRRLTPLLLLWLVMSVVIAVVARLVQPAQMSAPLAPLWGRPLIAGDAIAFYLSKILLPMRLAVDYGRSPDKVLAGGRAMITCAVAVLFIAATAVVYRRWPRLGAAGAVFLIGLLPVLGFIPFSFQFYSTVADHYLYLSMFGVALAMAWIVQKVGLKPALTLGALLVVALAARSWMQTFIWRDTITLFEHNLIINPRSPAAHENLTIAYLNRGDWAKAVDHGEVATRLRPADPDARLNYALSLRSAGALDDAIVQFREAQALAPRDPIIPMLLGSTYAQRADYPAAAEALLRAVQLDPSNREAAKRLADVEAALQATTTTRSSE